jgi:hypothetical protein
MPNATTGAKFMSLRSGSGDSEMFAIGYDGAMTMAAGLTITTGGITVSAGGINVTGNAIFNTGVSVSSGASISGPFTYTGGFMDINSGVSISSGASVSGTAVFTGALQPGGGVYGDMDQIAGPGTYSNYMEDFTDPHIMGSGTTSPWLFTQTTGTTSSCGTKDGEPLGVGYLSAASCSAARAQITLQHGNEFIKLLSNKSYYFETRFKVVNKLSAGQYYIGLTNADTDLFAGDRSAPDCTDFIGFANYTGGSWHFVCGTAAATSKNSATSTPNIVRATQGTYYRLGFSFKTTGTTVVYPYVDGVRGAAPTEMTDQAGTSYPHRTALTISSGVSTGAAGGNRLEIDYINIVQER